MKIEQVAIADLKAADYNPRKLTEKQFNDIKDSLDRFGFVDPVIVNSNPERHNVIIGGHQRVKVWRTISGNTTVPVFYIDLSLEKEKELNIRLNRNTGEWDFDLLGLNFDHADLIEWGFDESDFKTETIIDPEATEDEYEIPEVVETDIIKGDLFQIGQHRLLCGDSTSTDDWGKVMDGGFADLIVTDPPYNVDYEGGTGLKIENDKQEDGDFYQFLYDFYVALNSYTKPGGAWYVWHADSEGVNFRTAMQDAGILMKQCLIWVKSSLVMGRQDYQWKHEPCLYGWKEGAAHYFTDERFHTTVIEDKVDYKKLSKAELLACITEMTSDKTKSTVIHCDKPFRNDVHPTMKPILLLSPLIKNSSRPDEIVADGFLGSGSTMVAAHQLGRKCYGMELDPKYCRVIIDRMRKLDPTLTLLRNGEPWVPNNL